MAGKYNYSLERLNIDGQKEVLSVTGCDSFDEAIKIVTKGAYERTLEEDSRPKEAGLMGGAAQLRRGPMIPPGVPVIDPAGGSTAAELGPDKTTGGPSTNPQG